jgi:hypothetical protein
VIMLSASGCPPLPSLLDLPEQYKPRARRVTGISPPGPEIGVILVYELLLISIGVALTCLVLALFKGWRV